MPDTCAPIQPSVTPANPEPPASSAIARCVEAYFNAWNVEKPTVRDEATAILNARKAYRSALPPLAGHENIRDFIACVAHAMLLRAIDNDDASKLLYAAPGCRLSAARVQTAPVIRPSA